jgi:hypothetical protein
VVDKIKKLLALAEGNQNHHERQNAMQFAAALLAKHNLTIAELGSREFASTVTSVEVFINLERWVENVLGAACMLFYTDYYTGKRQNSRGTWQKIPIFVGTRDNIEVTLEMATWLLNSIRTESNKAYKSASERRSFRLGAAHTLSMRAFDLVWDERTQECEHASTSLTLVRENLEQANERFMSKLHLNPGRLLRRCYVDREAFDDGETYGGTVPLTRERVKSQPKLLTSR